MKCKYCNKETENPYCSQEHEENHAVFNILENITDELDITFGATRYPWKVLLTSKSYDTVKNRPGTHWVPEAKEYQPRKLVYEKDGHEWLVCWENHNIPFIIHARIASKDADADDLELDDFDRPNIKEEYRKDFESFQISLD
jgi:hypothetical protein